MPPPCPLFCPCYIINNNGCPVPRFNAVARWRVYFLYLGYGVLGFFQRVKFHCYTLGLAPEFTVPQVRIHFPFAAFGALAYKGYGKL